MPQKIPLKAKLPTAAGNPICFSPSARKMGNNSTPKKPRKRNRIARKTQYQTVQIGRAYYASGLVASSCETATGTTEHKSPNPPDSRRSKPP
jgi:hypothetical protein